MIWFFANPPKSTEGKPAAIVDVLDSNLIVVASKQSVFEVIIEAIGELGTCSQLNLKTKTPTKTTGENPNQL